MLKIKNLILKILYSFNDFFDLRGSKARSIFNDTLAIKEKSFSSSKIKIGIVKEKWGLHSYYVKACIDKNISFQVIDIFDEDWFEKISDKNLEYIVIRPSVQYTPWKDAFDNKLMLLGQKSTARIYPNPKLLWLWENKLRMMEWAKLNGLKHIDFKILYSLDRLKKYSKSAKYPLIYKSSSGSGSSGVKIFKNSNQLLKFGKSFFRKGIRTYRKQKLDIEHGSMIIQKYLDNLIEWRIIRIGRYYFGFQKLKSGNFHSGSKNFSYGMPPRECLDYARQITDKFKFYFTSIDFFCKNGIIYLNEIQPYFGQHKDRELLVIDNQSGRLHFDKKKSKWNFEPGSFCKNNLCDLRLSEINNMHSK